MLTLVFSLTACSAGGSEETTASQASNAAADSTAAPAEQTGDKKILVVYYSPANTAADITSSATPYFDDLGSTEYVAEYIHSRVGGDIAKITPVSDYPDGYNDTVDAAKTERDNDERPAYAPLAVNPEDYDVIIVGYPLWWYTLPMIMYTFFDDYDFSGKTIIPFNTHAGSGESGSYDTIREFEPNATVLEGLPLSGEEVDKSEKDIDSWLDSLQY